MITLLHITIALASVAYMTALMFRPTLNIATAYGSITATLLSGILLVVVQPATLAHVCVSGVVYLAVSAGVLAFTRHQKAKYFTTV